MNVLESGRDRSITTFTNIAYDAVLTAEDDIPPSSPAELCTKSTSTTDLHQTDTPIYIRPTSPTRIQNVPRALSNSEMREEQEVIEVLRGERAWSFGHGTKKWNSDLRIMQESERYRAYLEMARLHRSTGIGKKVLSQMSVISQS